MKAIEQLPKLNIMRQDLREGRCIQLEGCVPSQMEQLVLLLGEPFDFTVIVASDEQKAAEIRNNCGVFQKNTCLYPARDPVFFKADIQGSFLSEQRTEVIRRIYENEKCAIVTTLEAFSDRLSSMQQIREDIIHIRTGDTLDPEELAEHLVYLGYAHETQASGHGEFSVRGSIIDIFPYAAQAPYRIDLFGDEVDSIRIFDTESQRSVEMVDEMTVFPGGDREAETDSRPDSQGTDFLDYFTDRKTLFVLYEPARMLKSILGMNPLEAAADTDDSDLLPEPGTMSLSRAQQILSSLTLRSSVILSSLGENPEQLHPFRHYHINARNIPSYNGRFLEMAEDLRNYRQKGYQVILECASELRAQNMIRNLAENGVTVGPVQEDPAHHVKASDIQVRSGAARIGFEYPDIRFALITEVDIFGARRNRKRRKRYSGDPIREFSDLGIGDYVVHEQHGVGVYKGIERIKVDGIEKDYMKIEYAGNASLYVLATQFDKIQKYGGSEGAKPKLNRLGGREWANTKARVRSAVQDIAEDLVRLYAARQMQKGYCYSPDTVWQREFEDSFEYEETEDQLQAIEAVKQDMESGRIMDRLICGDVGFGKTEVAIRAAFKAVQDGKQAAFLTPTTILAQQHYNTLIRRLGNYPVTVKMLSRFATPLQQKEIIKGLAGGQVDIVVGTHRLLSKDVKFRDLGLLIVDEEQRFGVAHKEKIKSLRNNVDVITLSATPIPRTLHMSLTGIRDMSLLTEPPVDRLPIQTYVMEYSEDAVKEAILRERARGGQVYYVYNRTNNIDLVADRIAKMLPQVHVAYAHGKMSSRELEAIMFDFIDGQIDVLVSTTIIETGLDIPNVNTIIIHDADSFGLSQLYQLRGRVGRSNRTAYAFLMYRKDKLIREVAEKRLKAIREFSDLGSGIRIAMRDLEIRGAGNVLGAEQSGHMEAVGYELYCKMLNQAVAQLKGEHYEEDFETTIDLNVDGYIPATYIVNEFEKLNMYKRISSVTDREEMEDLRSELTDRFGEIPRVTENLLIVAYIKSRAHRLYITEIANDHRTAGAYRIHLLPNAPVDTYKLLDTIRQNEKILRFVSGSDQYFLYTPEKEPHNLEEIRKTLEQFFDILTGIMETDL